MRCVYIYICHSPPPPPPSLSLCSPPPFLLPNQNAFSQPIPSALWDRRRYYETYVRYVPPPQGTAAPRGSPSWGEHGFVGGTQL